MVSEKAPEKGLKESRKGGNAPFVQFCSQAGLKVFIAGPQVLCSRFSRPEDPDVSPGNQQNMQDICGRSFRCRIRRRFFYINGTEPCFRYALDPQSESAP